jgi:chemotaxis protein CheD
MKDIYMEKFNQNVKIISIGEFYATGKKEGIATVLGSCISACIYEEGGGIGGMNHFLVPGDFRDEEIFLSPVARYGMFAMELLMGELIKLKVDRARLKAKIFGGSDLLNASTLAIGKNNIRFIKAFLGMEGIPIVSNDIGGKDARKIFFFPHSGKVMVKRISQNMNKIIGIEDKYHQKAQLEM